MVKIADPFGRFIEKSQQIHGDKYDYSLAVYINTKTKITIICPKHGEFEQLPLNHTSGTGCPQCAKVRHLDKENPWEAAKKIHGDKYDYSNSNFNGVTKKIKIVCPKHGEFEQTYYNHVVAGQGCVKCEFDRRKLPRPTDRLTNEQAIAKCVESHGDKYDYSKMVYTGNKKPITIICKKHGEFEQTFNDHTFHQTNCPKCATTQSSEQLEIIEFIKSIYRGSIVTNDRTILSNNKELDIFIPEFNLAIEYCGLRWHTEWNRPSQYYHQDKFIRCRMLDIDLLTIYSDEWQNSKDIIKSMIANKLHLTTNKIGARQCYLKEIPSKQANEFYDKNHIRGSTTSLNVSYGLFYGDQLISAMSFGKHPRGVEGIVLKRFCNKLNTNVVGAASKLFKHASQLWDEIISWSDNRYSAGNLYITLGFKFDGEIPPRPDYVNIVGRTKRYSNQQMQKIKVGCPKDVKLSDFLEQQNLYRIWDCGKIRWKWKRPG